MPRGISNATLFAATAAAAYIVYQSQSKPSKKQLNSLNTFFPKKNIVNIPYKEVVFVETILKLKQKLLSFSDTHNNPVSIERNGLEAFIAFSNTRDMVSWFEALNRNEEHSNFHPPYQQFAQQVGLDALLGIQTILGNIYFNSTQVHSVSFLRDEPTLIEDPEQLIMRITQLAEQQRVNLHPIFLQLLQQNGSSIQHGLNNVTTLCCKELSSEYWDDFFPPDILPVQDIQKFCQQKMLNDNPRNLSISVQCS